MVNFTIIGVLWVWAAEIPLLIHNAIETDWLMLRNRATVGADLVPLQKPTECSGGITSLGTVFLHKAK